MSSLLDLLAATHLPAVHPRLSSYRPMASTLAKSLRAPFAARSGSARLINSTATRSWDEVRPQRHPSDLANKHLKLPQTVAVIGAPMTRVFPYRFAVCC